MSNESEDLIRRAYEAYSEGDLVTMLRFVDPDLEWTYLDPTWRTPPRRSATAATNSRPPWSAERNLAWWLNWKKSSRGATG
jgi:ketosteroid isomerase-like protein